MLNTRALALALVLICGLCFCSPARAAASTPQASTCTASGGCGEEAEEEASLVQRLVKNHQHQEFPDLDKIAKQAQDMVGKARTVADDVLTDGITMLSSKINSMLSTLQERADKYAKDVNASSGAVTVGVASLLGRRFNTSKVVGVSERKLAKYEEDAQNKVNDAVDFFDSLVESLDGTAAGVTQVPLGKRELTKALNTTLQTALSKCSELLASLKDVQSLIEPEPDGSLVQVPVREDPSTIVGRLDKAMINALDLTSGFSDSVSQAFHTLSDSVVKATDGKISFHAVAKVRANFAGLASKAESVTRKTKEATIQLLHSLSKGVDATGIMPSGAVGAKLGFLVVLFAAFASTV